MEVMVVLNGTDTNPFLKMGLRANPFPAIADASPKYAYANRLLSRLSAEPIRDVDHLRELLSGCAPEFVEFCVSKFKPGERVRFRVGWPD